MENESGSLCLTASPNEAGKRLDLVVSEMADVSRSAAARLIEEGDAVVNGRPVAKNYKLRAGDVVEITLPEPEPAEAQPEDIPLDVVYEDTDVIVVNKPCGMVVHPGAGNPTGTLVNALLYRCGATLSGVGGVIRPGIVHRIDKDTSGLLVVAKHDAAHLTLSEQLKGHRIDRVYYAIAIGDFQEDAGTVNAPIARHPIDRKRMAVVKGDAAGAREAITHWSVLARGVGDGARFTLLRCCLETGRTHQIRVHMASIGHPLLGDPVYGGDRTQFEGRHRTLIQGQCLHAGELHFRHPVSGEELHLFCPMPNEMEKAVTLLFGKEYTTVPQTKQET